MANLGIPDSTALDRRAWMLRPTSLFAAVWAVTLGIWLGVSSGRFKEITGAERHFSLRALLFIVGCVALFAVGSLIARSHPGGSSGARSWDHVWWVERPPLQIAERFAIGALVVGGGAVLFTFYRSASSAGGTSSFLDQFASGRQSWSAISASTVDPAASQGISTWVHALTAIAPLAALGVCLGAGRQRARFAVIGIAGFALVSLQALIHSERITAFQYPLIFAFAYFLFSTIASRAGNEFRRLLRYGVLLLGLLALLWSVSEINRQFVNTGSRASRSSGAAIAFAGDRFLAYIGANANNLSYAIDHDTTPSYAYFLGRGALTTLRLDRAATPIVGAAVPETQQLLWKLYGGRPLTTFSAIGDAYRDLLWASAGIFLILGFAMSRIWLAATQGSLLSLVVYPLCAVAIIVSFQVFRWSETPFLIPFVILVAFAYVAGRSQPRERGAPHVSVPSDVAHPPA
jgi:hypothetical protein